MSNKTEPQKSARIIDIMLSVSNKDIYYYYHKSTNSFDRQPITDEEFEKLKKNINMIGTLSEKDEDNIRFLSYEEIDHEDIMRFFVRECVEDKESRRRLFNILRRIDYVSAFVEELKKLDLYDEYEYCVEDIYIQLFTEWSEKNGLDFSKKK